MATLTPLVKNPAAPGVLLGILGFMSPWLESSMTRHMTLELPMLFGIGWIAAQTTAPRMAEHLTPWNKDGIPALLAAFLISIFWMLPVALDLAVLNLIVATLKIISLVGIGLILGATWEKTPLALQAFFVLNWVWMMSTAGFLYRDAPEQLCAVYLSDQQSSTGLGLVIISVAVFSLWVSGVYSQTKNAETKLE